MFLGKSGVVIPILTTGFYNKKKEKNKRIKEFNVVIPILTTGFYNLHKSLSILNRHQVVIPILTTGFYNTFIVNALDIVKSFTLFSSACV